MKIAGSNWHIPGAESLYRQFRPQSTEEAAPADQSKTDNSGSIATAEKSSSPQSILNSREIDTLKALFGEPGKDSFYYGRNKVRNVASGHLLDVKG